jgi:hypothetical protein
MAPLNYCRLSAIDAAVVCLVCVLCFFAYAHYQAQDAQAPALAVAALLASVVAERCAWRIHSGHKQFGHPAPDPAEVRHRFEACVRSASWFASLVVPCVVPSNWKTMERLQAVSQSKRSIPESLAFGWILFAGVLGSILMTPPQAGDGISARLLFGSPAQLTASAVVAGLLSWWSLTFFSFQFGLHLEKS